MPLSEPLFSTKYGSFTSARAYTITSPDAPRPWSNVICNGRYGLIVSHRGGGFSWFDDAQHNVLTRWEMDLVRDCYGKFLYISDLDSGDIWSAAPTPCQTRFDRYRCTHELGASTFETSAHGIDASWTLTVPRDHACEVWVLKLTNTTKTARKLRVASYFEWTCGVAPDVKREFHRLFITTRHDSTRKAILATKNMWDVPGLSEKEHWNVPWPYVAALSVQGPFERDLAIADKATFLGRYGSTASPRAMHKDAAPVADAKAGNFGRFGDACAALGGDLTIAPGASVTIQFVIAIAQSKNQDTTGDDSGVLALLDKAREPGFGESSLASARQLWTDTLAPTQVATSSPEVNLLANHWLPYQAISGRLWGRTGYYQQSGAFGYRDQLQDSQIWLPLDPTRCANQIMLHAGRMFEDGSVNHWWHDLVNFGNHTECSDDYLWLPFVTSSYLRETDDLSILQRTAGFQKSTKTSTLLDHCNRAVERAFQRMSPRGLPLIGSCDWNDGLSAVGLDGKGESIWLAMFICHILSDWAIIHARLGDAKASQTCKDRRERLIKAINEHAWDESSKSSYFRCATKDSGEWIGASSSPEGKIHLNPQTWNIFAKTSDQSRRDRAWQAVKDQLLTPYGPLLLAPAYTKPDPDIGYITRYSPGSRENGGVYMHAATWALAAACEMRDQASVDRIWKSIAPPLRASDPDAYNAEPYVLPGNVDGPLGEKPGSAGWTWYTGSAAWLRRVLLEWVFGVRAVWTPTGETGLVFDPVPPAGLGQVTFTRAWRGRTLEVRFDAAKWKPVAPTVTLDGETLADGVLTETLAKARIPLGKVAQVHVEWR